MHPIGVQKKQEEIFYRLFQQVYKESKAKQPFGDNSKVTITKFRQAVQEYLAECLVEWDDISEAKQDEMVLLYKKRPVYIFNHSFFKNPVNGRKKVSWKRVQEVIGDSIQLLVEHLYSVDRDIYILKQIHRAYQQLSQETLTGHQLKDVLQEAFAKDDSFWKLKFFSPDSGEGALTVGQFFNQYGAFTLDDLIKLKQRDMAEIRFIAPKTVFKYVSNLQAITPAADGEVVVLTDVEASTLSADRSLGRRSSLSEEDLAHFAQLATESHTSNIESSTEECETQTVTLEKQLEVERKHVEALQQQLAAQAKELKQQAETIATEKRELETNRRILEQTQEEADKLKKEEKKALDKLAAAAAKEKKARETEESKQKSQTAVEKRFVLEQEIRTTRRLREAEGFTTTEQVREYYLPVLTGLQTKLSQSAADKKPLYLGDLILVEEEYQNALNAVNTTTISTESRYQYSPVYIYNHTKTRLPQILLQHYHTVTTKKGDLPSFLSYLHQLGAIKQQRPSELGLMYALATLEEWQIWKRQGKRVHLPTSSVPGLDSIEDILDFLRRNNLSPTAETPTLTTYLRILTPWNLKSALFKYGPLLLALPVYSENLTFWKGNGKHQGYHTMLIVGYTEKSVKVRNSFGVEWGDAGYIEISLAEIFQYGHYVIACIDGPSHAQNPTHRAALAPVL